MCFPAQTKFLLCFFYGAIEKAKAKRERRGASRARHKRKREQRARLCPSPPKNTQGVWLAAQSPGSKVRGKVSFVPSIPLVLKDADAHPYSHINTCLHTYTHIHTHLYLLEGGSDLSLCSANQKTVLTPRCVPHRRGAAVGTSAGLRFAFAATLLLYAVQRLVTDSNNNQ